MFLPPRMGSRYLDGLRLAGLSEDGLSARADPANEAPDFAALPFENVSEDSEVEPLARGLDRAIRENFGTIGFRFVDPSRTAEYRDVPPCEAAQQLEVRRIYDGSVERFGDQVRVFVELVGCPGSVRLWSDDYDGAVSGDLLGLRWPRVRRPLSGFRVHAAHAVRALPGPEGPDAGLWRMRYSRGGVPAVSR